MVPSNVVSCPGPEATKQPRPPQYHHHVWLGLMFLFWNADGTGCILLSHKSTEYFHKSWGSNVRWAFVLFTSGFWPWHISTEDTFCSSSLSYCWIMNFDLSSGKRGLQGWTSWMSCWCALGVFLVDRLLLWSFITAPRFLLFCFLGILRSGRDEETNLTFQKKKLNRFYWLFSLHNWNYCLKTTVWNDSGNLCRTLIKGRGQILFFTALQLSLASTWS